MYKPTDIDVDLALFHMAAASEHEGKPINLSVVIVLLRYAHEGRLPSRNLQAVFRRYDKILPYPFLRHGLRQVLPVKP